MQARAGAETPLATKPFILLCVTMFLGYANQWMLTPVIPLYVQSLGGSATVAGLALLAFSIPSFAVRPLVGRIADRWNAAGVQAVGLASLAAGTLVFLVPSIVTVFVGGVVRGLGWAGFNTGGYTTLASAAPQKRRGEAAGYYTSAATLASVIFPALGLWVIAGAGGYPAVFVISTLLAVVALPFAVSLAKTISAARQSAPPDDAPREKGLLERGVLIATGLNLCSALIMPSVMAFLPLYALSLGIGNIGLFYILAGVTSVVVRPVLGKKSDAIGRGPAIAIGLACNLIGLTLITVASGIALILAGGFFVAVGMSMIGSTSTALAMDLANPRSRGRSMATFSVSFQIGNGVGGIVSGALADIFGLRAMYVGSIVITLGGFILLASAWKTLPRPHKAA